MRFERWMVALWATAACQKDTTDVIVPPDTDTPTDTGTPTDTDSGTPTDTDTDTTPTVPAGLCEPLTVPGSAIAVAAGSDLQVAIDAAPDGATLALADGVYDVNVPIVVDKPITIVSASADASKVTIDGGYIADDLFRIDASDVTLAHLKLTHAYDALVSVVPTKVDLLRPKLHMLELVDPGRVGVTTDNGVENYDGPYADDGEVSCNSLELTLAGRGEVRGVCEVSGVELFGTRGWTVRDNDIRGLYCEIGWSGPAIIASRGVRDTVITRNNAVDVSFGIVLGETADQVGRVYDDAPCGAGVFQSIDGWVTNNIVAAYDEDLFFDPDNGNPTAGFLTGIRVETSCNAMVLHNSVYSKLLPYSAALEQKFPTTTGIVANNLLSHEAVRYVKADADVYGNVEFVDESVWYWPANRDFHLSSGATDLIDHGDPITVDDGLITDDIDGEPRSDGAPDVGADEKP